MGLTATDPRGARPGHGALLHDHAAAGRGEGGVHPPDPLQSESARQHDRLARRALRPPALRAARRLRLPQAEEHLWAAPHRRADRPGSDHLPAAVALEPTRLDGDPRLLARHPHRAVAHLRAAPLPSGRARSAAGAPARDRRLWQPDRHGADARAGTRQDLRRPGARGHGQRGDARASATRSDGQREGARPARARNLHPRATGPAPR